MLQTSVACVSIVLTGAIVAVTAIGLARLVGAVCTTASASVATIARTIVGMTARTTTTVATVVTIVIVAAMLCVAAMLVIATPDTLDVRQMIASARARGLLVGEAPVPTHYGDEVSHLNPLTYGLRVLRVMWNYRRGRYDAA